MEVDQHQRKTSLERVCAVLLEEFDTPGALEARGEVAAKLLLSYHKAGLSCFEIIAE